MRDLCLSLSYLVQLIKISALHCHFDLKVQNNLAHKLVPCMIIYANHTENGGRREIS